jgi:hypothetical protein
MTSSLAELELRRAQLLEELSELGSFRPGSISALVRRCGKPGCRCSEPGDPGHGPNLRLTYKVNGKSKSESLPDRDAVRKARREIARFRRFQVWTREFTEVNEAICREVGSGPSGHDEP